MGNNLKERSRKFALDVFGLVDGLPVGRTAALIGKQLLRSGISFGANYRAACRAKSPADFIAKMGIVEAEADELVAITVSSIKTAKANKIRRAK